MKFKSVLFFVIIFILMAFTHKDLNKKIDKEIKDTFKIAQYTYLPINFSAEITKTLPSTFEANNFISIHANSTLLGYAYMGKAPSKTDQFDYLVLLDKDRIVIKTKILAYREDYGGEIGSTRWLRQFEGKTQNDNLKLGDNIVAISGATISVRSMTNDMNNLLQSLKILQLKKVL